MTLVERRGKFPPYIRAYGLVSHRALLLPTAFAADVYYADGDAPEVVNTGIEEGRDAMKK